MNRWKPSRKVGLGAGGIGVPAAIFVAWVLQMIAGVEVPGEVQAAIGAMISTAIAYLLPE